jgi:hypothetical protein
MLARVTMDDRKQVVRALVVVLALAESFLGSCPLARGDETPSWRVSAGWHGRKVVNRASLAVPVLGWRGDVPSCGG